jgi:ferredoxin
MARRQPADPIYRHPSYAAAVKHWRANGTHCARCGTTLDRTPGATGPTAYQCGHIIDKHTARAAGWPIEAINAITNTQPECQRCNTSHGARLGNQLRDRALPQPTNTRRW